MTRASRAKLRSRYSHPCDQARVCPTSSSEGAPSISRLAACCSTYSARPNSSLWSRTRRASPRRSRLPESARLAVTSAIRTSSDASQPRRRPGCLPRWGEQVPAGRADRRVHVPREDREPLDPVVRAAVVPRVHLPERHAHLVVDVLLLDPCAHEIGLQGLGELLQLEGGRVVVDQHRLAELLGRLDVVLFVAELEPS